MNTGNVCRLEGCGLAGEDASGQVTELGVVPVLVAPVDVVGDQPALGLVVGVVGAVQAEVAESLELRLDPVQPGGVVGRVGELDVVVGSPLADVVALGSVAPSRPAPDARTR